jgi:hypothetical protein
VATKKQKKRARAKMEVRKASEGPLSTPPGLPPHVPTAKLRFTQR